jgi:hypothetical protein
METRACCVCGVEDARALVGVVLLGGSRATLCGSHALMHRRSRSVARTERELRTELRDRRADRAARDRRGGADELGASLVVAFVGERRAADRRRGS